MTNETRERIKYYKEQLPHMKEKLAAAIMMLIIAASVTVTATYAWITLSTAPEATSIDTTVAANGSLEIALASGTGDAPGKSAVGDSTGAGTKINLANTTWGNLVNLSDPSYGLSKITLRPAALNGTSGLLTNPLFGVGYGEDGRVDSAVSDDDFAYVYFDPESGTNGAFLTDLEGKHLGVRAISTVKYENLEGDNTLAELLQLTNAKLYEAKINYIKMTNQEQEPGASYINTLEDLIEDYAQNVIDRKTNDKIIITDSVPDLYKMMQHFYDSVMLPAGESYVQMANMLELMKGSGSEDAGYSVDELVEASRAGTLPDYIKNNISSLSGFATDYITLKEYLLKKEASDFSDLTASEKRNSLAYWAYYSENVGDVTWADLNSQINWICKIDTAELDGYTLSGLMAHAKDILGSNKGHQAVIHGGAIYRMEKRLGQKMDPAPTISVTIDANSISTLIGEKTLKAVLTTSADEPYEMPADRDAIKALNTGSFKGDTATAEDTYAIALDFWVRTNAGSDESAVTDEPVVEELEDGTIKSTKVTTSPEQAYLTLEGAVKMGVQEAQATLKDINGNEQLAYVAECSVNGETYQKNVYERYGSYYYIDEANGKEVDVQAEVTALAKENNVEVPTITYTKKMLQKNVVIGYEGINRVWNEEQMAGFSGNGTSTTQGGGSCYVFYADNPADQSRFLSLLNAMRIVFVNADGRRIGTAYLDTANYFAETGKVTVPLVLDKNQAINLGVDIEGNTIYGLTALKKNAATRITALVYLDGNNLSNDIVLASGDIQGTLNIQFGSSVALMKTTTITESKTEGETTTETTNTVIDYIVGKDSEAIKDEKVMNQFVEVSAKVNKDTFEYNSSTPATANLEVDIDGLTPSHVSVRFMRAISSTQGVQQESVSLNGSDSKWSANCTFEKPGTYILRSVWIDGVEYNLDSPLKITVTGSSVTSLTCESIPAGSNRSTIMTANNSYSTKMTLGFNSDAVNPSSVNGFFMDESGRTVNVPFYLKEGEWKGTAKFTTSGTFTMEYVEIDGEIYELDERLQTTLEILLGLKAQAKVSASKETLDELQKILPGALATNFVLTKPVTLQVAVELYDNNGNEIVGLSNASLYYGRVGSSISSTGLDTDLIWDAEAGCYKGAFSVTKAGTYRFSKVVIASSNDASAILNTIERYTEASNIQAMPPEDAEYYNNYTEPYQYAPEFDASMTIGIAYSNAATKVKATITNGKIIDVVEGSIGLEVNNQDGKIVNLWSFKIPSSSKSQEGEWTLTDITMYGVYYDDKYYENGITVDLRDKNICTKVVNYLNVTLGVGTERTFKGYFMDDHKVEDMTVTINDYENLPIEGVEIGDLKVVYYLDSLSTTKEKYGYVADGLSSVNVSGNGNLKEGSQTEYSISAMNFQYAGLYKNCVISFTIDGVNVNATVGTAGINLRYNVNGVLTDDIPQYEVTWTAPTITVTGTDPAPTETFNINLGGGSEDVPYEVHNYYEDFYARIYCKYGGMQSCVGQTVPSYSVSKVTLTLTNAGSKLSSSNTATFTVPATSSGENYDSVFTFNSNGKSVTEEIGADDAGSGFTRVLPNVTISTIAMKYGETTFVMNLSNAVTINESNGMPGSLSYEIPEEYAKEAAFTTVDLSKQTGNGDGRSFDVTLPVIENFTVTRDIAGDLEVINTEDKESTVYYSETTSSGCSSTTTYYPYLKADHIVTSEAVKETHEITYQVTGWKIISHTVSSSEWKENDKGTKAPGASFTVTSGQYYTVEPVIEEVRNEIVATNIQTLIETTTTVTAQSTTTNRPSGTSYNSKEKIEALAGTTQVWK